jgi:hypothetical protein
MLDPVDTAKGTGPSALEVSIVKIPSIRLGPLIIHDTPVVIASLEFLDHELGTRVDAIIGLDLLRRANFTVLLPGRHSRGSRNQALVEGASKPTQAACPQASFASSLHLGL